MVLFRECQKSSIKLCVVVPVKDEEHEILNTLHALYNQVDSSGNKLNKDIYEVLLLINNSKDRSYQIALNYRNTHTDFNLFIEDINLAPPVAHIGKARRLLMDEAYRRFMSNQKPDGIIVSTDGDSQVDAKWVWHILMAMSKGVDAVGGRIIPVSLPSQVRLPHLQNVAYRYYVSRLETIINPCPHDPWPRHFQCYGPSLAVTCKAYERAGRIPILPYLEDEEFRKALYRMDAKVRMCPDVKIYTSSRFKGKVDFGFSVQLKEWALNSADKVVYVETLEELLEKFELKHSLKQCWSEGMNFISIRKLSTRFQMDREWLKLEAKATAHFGEFWEKVESHISADEEWRNRFPLAPIRDVIIQLRSYIHRKDDDSNSDTNLKDIA